MLLQDINRSRIWDAFREMEQLQSQLNRLLGSGRDSESVDYPPLKVWSSENEALVTAEVPGIEPDNLEISVINQALTIRGSRPPVELKEGERHHRRERGAGEFARTIELPFRVDPERVNAQYKKGILYVNLPRAAQDKPRKISVKAD